MYNMRQGVIFVFRLRIAEDVKETCGWTGLGSYTHSDAKMRA